MVFCEYDYQIIANYLYSKNKIVIWEKIQKDEHKLMKEFIKIFTNNPFPKKLQYFQNLRDRFSADSKRSLEITYFGTTGNITLEENNTFIFDLLDYVGGRELLFDLGILSTLDIINDRLDSHLAFEPTIDPIKTMITLKDDTQVNLLDFYLMNYDEIKFISPENTTYYHLQQLQLQLMRNNNKINKRHCDIIMKTESIKFLQRMQHSYRHTLDSLIPLSFIKNIKIYDNITHYIKRYNISTKPINGNTIIEVDGKDYVQHYSSIEEI
jgi:hypothetical protein